MCAKVWVFRFIPNEMWDEVDKLADVHHQQFFEGLKMHKNSQHNQEIGSTGVLIVLSVFCCRTLVMLLHILLRITTSVSEIES